MDNLMIMGYGGWYMPSRRPTIDGLRAKYDKGKEKTSESQSQSFRQIQGQALDQALQAFMDQGRIGTGQESFPGERIAPFSEVQQQAISPQELGGFLDIFRSGRNIPFFGDTGSALQGILRGETGAEQITPEQALNVFQQTRVDPRIREFERFGKPLIEEQFAGPNFQSSARANEVALAGERLGQDIADERSQFLFDVENINRQLGESRANRALNAVPLGIQATTIPEQVAAARLAGRGGVFDFAGSQQQQQQAQIQSQREAFQEAQRFMDPEDLATLMGLLGLNFTTQNTTGFAPSMRQAFNQKLGSGLGSGAAAGIGGFLGGIS